MIAEKSLNNRRLIGRCFAAWDECRFECVTMVQNLSSCRVITYFLIVQGSGVLQVAQLSL